MKTYNVKEIAEMLKTNPETVRRWIRSGKLKAEQQSKKGGNSISEASLIAFLEVYPKYAGYSIAGIPGLFVGSAIGTLAELVIQGISNEYKIPYDKIITFISDLINSSTNAIEQKKEQIKSIQKDISKEEARICEYQKILNNIRSQTKGVKLNE